jgi:hypothetical protein
MMNEIFRLVGSVVVDTESAKKNINEVTKHAETQQKKLQQKLADFGKATIKFGTAFATTAIAVGNALKSVAENTRSYRQEMGKLTTAFTTNDFSAENARATYKGLVAVLGETDQAVEAAGHIAAMATSTNDLSYWLDICTGVYGTFGASLPIEGLTEAANETAKTGQLTGQLADALNWAGVNEEDFQRQLNACGSEEERVRMITETLVGIYGDAANAYRETNHEVMAANLAHDNLNSAMAKVGAAAEPIVTTFTNFAAKLVEKATPAVENMADGIGSILENFEAFGAWIEENKTIITAFLGAVVIALLAVNAPLVLLGAGILFVASNWKVLENGVQWCIDKIDEFFNITIPQAFKDMNKEIGTWWEEKVNVPIRNAIAAIKEFLGLNEKVAPYEPGHGHGNNYADWMMAQQNEDSPDYDTSWEEYATKYGIPHKNGLDFVPRDDYLARLHYGEAVLTQSEATAWRNGQQSGMDYDRLAEAMAQRPMAFNIDGKAFAVMLARELSRTIGNRNIQSMMAMGG